MRSPWQLFKGFASRRKSDVTVASPDEAAPTSDPQVDLFEQINARQRELEGRPQSIADGNKTDRQPASVGADAQQSLPAAQTDPVPSQPAASVAPEAPDQPAPVATAVTTIDGIGGTETVPKKSKGRRAKAVSPRENLGKRAVFKTALAQPVATKKTATDEASELDLEIKSLRLKLSAKLLEQNAQLRRMIDRYGGT
ncbi:hypothetical protein [Rhizobium sp. Root1204]|uniref:hypothetical protein n=1 Tax=Rhizobium sp. Root1204 TaxID=1736428 RepID=UPI0007149F23|nr:hypothetical protein [Rhizobium sp. Root1204]KQV36258.1 hypothetical protein ASC96_28655 [Rhizobium sp. Root1204]